MDFVDFYNQIKEKLEKIDISLGENSAQKLYQYMKMVIEWNEKINLTAIIEPKDFILKHFVDSLTVAKEVEDDSKVIDVGTGAGFPGIPLKIENNSLNMVLLDSLNKRLNFLNEVIATLNLKNVETVHARAEEFSKNKKYREQYDVTLSRAVAPLNVLLEYLLPLVKVGGKAICMKGSNAEEEIEDSKKALEILGGKIETVKKMALPDTDIKREIIIVRKVKETPLKYPRKPGTPSKEPIL